MTLQESPGTVPAGRLPRHREVILNLMRALDINADGPIGRAWLRLPGTKKVPGLARRAHRDSLSQPRPVTDEMRTFWDEMDQVFEVVLDGFNTKLLAESYAAMDELLTRTTPGPSSPSGCCQAWPG